MQLPSEITPKPAEDVSPIQLKRKETPWKLIIFCAVFVFSFMLFAFYPPAKQLLNQMETFFRNNGMYGSVCLVLFVGCLVVPLGLPYSMFEMIFAIMFDNFLYAVALTTIAQTIGSTISYVLTKYILKEKLKLWLKDHQIYKGIEAVLSKDPVKFSFILRLTNFPLLIKNYGLAIPDNIGFKVYTWTSIIGTVFVSAPQIYIFQEAQQISALFGHKESPLKTAFTFLTILLSVSIIVYIVWYTKKMLNDIKQQVKIMSSAELKEIQIEAKEIAECANDLEGGKNDDMVLISVSPSVKSPDEPTKINIAGHLFNVV